MSPDLWVHVAQEPQPLPFAAPPEAGTWALERISAGYAWGKRVVGRANTRMCIVDSGVDCGHPDLQLRPTGPSDEAGASGAPAAPRSMCVEGVKYKGGVETVGVQAAADEAGHGTKVAGVVAAAGDGAGAAGVMYAGVRSFSLGVLAPLLLWGRMCRGLPAAAAASAAA